MSNIHGFHTLNSSSSSSSGRPVTSSQVPQQGRNFAPLPQQPQDVSPEGGLSMMIGPGNPDGSPQSWTQRLLPRATWYSVTAVLSVIHGIIFFTELIVGQAKFDGAFVSDNSMGGPSGQTMLYMGGKYAPYIRNDGAVWRLFTPIFLHAGILHILSNILFQLRFGFTLEARWGSVRFAVVYFLTGIGASLWSCVCAYETISVGASGALFGVLGADAAYIAYNYDEIPHAKMEAIMIAVMCVINIIFGFGGSTGVDNFAHIGGFLSGVTIAMCALPVVKVKPTEFMYRIGSWIAHTVHMVLFIALLWGKSY